MIKDQNLPAILPCPFCGRPGEVYENEVSRNVLEYTVACSLGIAEDVPCFCSLSYNHVDEFPVGWSTPEAAIQAWNTRKKIARN